MKCPRCGSEMEMDAHRKYSIPMCYNCGYMEGRNMEDNVSVSGKTNFAHLKTLNFNEAAAFISSGMGIDEEKLAAWLCELCED